MHLFVFKSVDLDQPSWATKRSTINKDDDDDEDDWISPTVSNDILHGPDDISHLYHDSQHGTERLPRYETHIIRGGNACNNYISIGLRGKLFIHLHLTQSITAFS